MTSLDDSRSSNNNCSNYKSFFNASSHNTIQIILLMWLQLVTNKILTLYLQKRVLCPIILDFICGVKIKLGCKLFTPFCKQERVWNLEDSLRCIPSYNGNGVHISLYKICTICLTSAKTSYNNEKLSIKIHILTKYT